MISAKLSPQNKAPSDSTDPMQCADQPSVAVLMATFNGEKYLTEQLNSIIGQTLSNWTIWASDDGSTDQTLALLKHHQRKLQPGRLNIVKGPVQGFAKNFIHLVCRQEIQADYFAFSDQDDLWDPEKLATAVAWLRTIPPGTAALYCSRTRLMTADGQPLGLPPAFKPAPHFANALVQSLTNGNTMVFNRAACRLIQEAGPEIDVFSHDWWAYLLTTGCGGKVFYDPVPKISYRQHANNLLGMNMGLRARIKRVRLAWNGRYRNWNDRNLHALARIDHLLTAENRRILALFRDARHRGPFGRLIGLMRSGAYRRNGPETFVMYIMAIFKKI